MDEAERPLCKCHNEPMVRSGHWKCSEKRKATQARYTASEKGKATQARYTASEKGKATQARANAKRRERLKAAGICTKCAKDVAISETLCFMCLGKQDEYNLTAIR